ncbi:hypothetical protein LOTGIDRAFT_235705 [Lottia gigantea]|uniref:Glutathione S-transferase 3, mitochondrial n=1 Tax=Lottia gigantea TaxID=225164 RepID=V3ZXM0_LOTGI|nr:hypothetical protein LOTGIDRAFT_235705 [Lottia gigantea]ESO85731.1 hypothetical protein LOTGIDRAFT_235705 [Lottia gigantea]
MGFEVSSDYGYVILVLPATWVIMNFLALNVMKARKKYNVEYPNLYSNNHNFNCVQRAHQNTLENLPFFIMFLLTGGLMFPKLCAASGVLYLISRLVYAHGYYTGDPAKRNYGAFGYAGLITLIVCTVITGLNMLGLV